MLRTAAQKPYLIVDKLGYPHPIFGRINRTFFREKKREMDGSSREPLRLKGVNSNYRDTQGVESGDYISGTRI